MKKPHRPIDNTPHESPSTPPSVRPASGTKAKRAPLRIVTARPKPTPEVMYRRATVTADDRRDARVYAAVSTLTESELQGRGEGGVDAAGVARHLHVSVDDVLDAFDRLILRRLLRLAPGTPARVQVAR